MARTKDTKRRRTGGHAPRFVLNYYAAADRLNDILDVIAEFGPNHELAPGVTLLAAAVVTKNRGHIATLIANRVDVNARDGNMDTPLHLACETLGAQDDKTIIESLLRAGADPTARNDQGSTPRDMIRA